MARRNMATYRLPRPDGRMMEIEAPSAEEALHIFGALLAMEGAPAARATTQRMPAPRRQQAEEEFPPLGSSPAQVEAWYERKARSAAALPPTSEPAAPAAGAFSHSRRREILPSTPASQAGYRDIKPDLRPLSSTQAGMPINLPGEAAIIVNALGGLQHLLGGRAAFDAAMKAEFQELSQPDFGGNPDFQPGGALAGKELFDTEGMQPGWSVAMSLRFKLLRQAGLTNGLARAIRNQLDDLGLSEKTYALKPALQAQALQVITASGFTPPAPGTRIRRASPNPRPRKNSLWLRAY